MDLACKLNLDDAMHMYASLDLHKKYPQAVVMEGDGTITKEERIENSWENMEKFSDALPPGTDVVIESSSTWYWVYQILSRRHRVVLSNPVKTKAITSAKLKTDRIDALKLADLLRGGYIAEWYIPPKRTMELRELVRYRANLVRMRTNVKNRIHAFLLMNNIKIDATPFSKAFVEELRKIDELKVRGYLRVMESIDAEIH